MCPVMVDCDDCRHFDAAFTGGARPVARRPSLRGLADTLRAPRGAVNI